MPSTREPTGRSAEEWLRHMTLLAARLGLGFLFFSQLFWKLPPYFGCPSGPNFSFTAIDSSGALKRSTGLCDWIGIESVWSHRERAFFAVDFNGDGTPDIALRLGWLVTLNGLFVERVVIPHFGLFGWSSSQNC